ncbi:MAG: helix-turn-helix domain-containing protein [Hyphomicrobium sp.]|jgi:transcriptional regulator with XRE-family HTH domain|nr:helix-turn-helix domain-containing protein [Hyphomicrobium sp.]
MDQKQPVRGTAAPGLSLGQRLRYARIKAGYSKARALAAALGVTANTYYRYERDESTPSFRTLAKIAVILDAPLSELLADGQETSEKNGFESKVSETPGIPGFTETHLPAPSQQNHIDPAAECSLLAWRLATVLCKYASNGSRKDEDASLKNITELYLELKVSPSAILAKHQSAVMADPSILMAAGRYLNAYHIFLEHQMKSGES